MFCSLHSSLLFHPHLTGKGAFKHNKEVMPRVAINTSKEERRQGRGCSVPEGVGPDAGYGEGRRGGKSLGLPPKEVSVLRRFLVNTTPGKVWLLSLSLPTLLFQVSRA